MIPGEKPNLRSYEDHLSLDNNREKYASQGAGRVDRFRPAPNKRSSTQSESIFLVRQDPIELKNDGFPQGGQIDHYKQGMPWDRITRLALQGEQIANQQAQIDEAFQKIHDRPAPYVREEDDSEHQINASSAAYETFLGSTLLNACKVSDVNGATLAIPGISSYSTLNMEDYSGNTALSYVTNNEEQEITKELILEKLLEKITGFLYKAYQQGNIPDLNNIITNLIDNNVDIRKICSMLVPHGLANEDIDNIEKLLKENFVLSIFKTAKSIINNKIHRDKIFPVTINVNNKIRKMYDCGISLQEIEFILRNNGQRENDIVQSLNFINKRYRSFANE